MKQQQTNNQQSHLTEEQIQSYRDRGLQLSKRIAIGDHLSFCADCRAKVRLTDQTASPFVADDLRAALREEPDHPSYEELAAYVNGADSPADRVYIETHIEGCAPCVREMRDLRGFRAQLSTYEPIAYSPAPKQSWFARFRFVTVGGKSRMPAAVGALAALALVSFFTVSFSNQKAMLAVLRQTNAEIAAQNRSQSRRLAEMPALQSSVSAMNDKNREWSDRFARLQAAEAAAERKATEAGKVSGAAASPSLTGGIPDGDATLVRAASGEMVRVQPLPAVAQRAALSGDLDVPKNLVAPLLSGQSTALRGEQSQPSKALFAAKSPVGTAVLSDRPAFVWSAMHGASYYVVHVVDSQGDEVPGSPSAPTPSKTWTPTRPLPRGATLSWQVMGYANQADARSDTSGSASGLPSGQQGTAKFMVLSIGASEAIQKQASEYTGSPTILAALYAHSGLLDDARRTLVSAPQSGANASRIKHMMDQLTGE